MVEETNAQKMGKQILKKLCKFENWMDFVWECVIFHFVAALACTWCFLILL